LLRQQSPPRASVPIAVDPLRIVVAWADPRSPAYPAIPQLPAEVRSILAALREPECRRIVVEELPHATPAALQRLLEERPPHVLHFIGHGDERPSGGVLALQGERPGSAAIAYADELAQWISSHPDGEQDMGAPRELRLVVLSACRTAAPGASVAAALLGGGVPAVLAMQLNWRDATAGLFTRAFYSALAEPRPVEDSVWQGR